MKTRHFLLFATVFLLTVFSACKKMPQHVGDSLQPNSSYIRVAFTGDQNISSVVERVDSLSTKSATYTLVGDLNDPHFGNTKTSFYTQIGLTSNDMDWGEGAVADSVVLQILYSGYYGDTLTPMTLRVYEVTEDMGADSAAIYYSNTSFEYGEELANYTFTPRPKTYNNIDDDTLNSAVIRIPINNTLAERFISDQETGFTSNEAFMNYFNGLYVDGEVASGTGSICYFNLLHTKSYMRVYYHNNYDTTFYDFNVSNKYIHFNHFEHDYSVAQAPITFNDTVNNPYLYVQSTAGVRSRIKFPNLAQWAKDQNTNVLVNEAKLILTGANGLINGVQNDTAMFTAPIQLVVAKAKADGSYSIIPDQFVGTEYFGGYYDKKTDQVWFRISEYVQDLILAGPDAENHGIFLYTYSGSFNAKRWIFHGPESQDTTKALRLEIIYSQIDD